LEYQVLDHIIHGCPSPVQSACLRRWVYLYATMYYTPSEAGLQLVSLLPWRDTHTHTHKHTQAHQRKRQVVSAHFFYYITVLTDNELTNYCNQFQSTDNWIEKPYKQAPESLLLTPLTGYPRKSERRTWSIWTFLDGEKMCWSKDAPWPYERSFDQGLSMGYLPSYPWLPTTSGLPRDLVTSYLGFT